MGCLFSSSDDEDGYQQQQPNAPLLTSPRVPIAEQQPASIPNFTSSRRAPEPVPVFSNALGAKAAAASARASSSTVFCPCGGPGARVKLLPCGHTALCLSCAQMDKACPVCGAAVQDSAPSFRAPQRS